MCVLFILVFNFSLQSNKKSVLLRLNIALIKRITWSLNRFLTFFKISVSCFSYVCYITESKLITDPFKNSIFESVGFIGNKMAFLKYILVISSSFVSTDVENIAQK